MVLQQADLVNSNCHQRMPCCAIYTLSNNKFCGYIILSNLRIQKFSGETNSVTHYVASSGIWQVPSKVTDLQITAKAYGAG
jgi:hypothetical protein